MPDHSSSSTSSSLASMTTTTVPCTVRTMNTTAAPATSAPSRSLPTAQDSRLRIEPPSPTSVASTAPIESRTGSALSASSLSSSSSTKVARLGIQSSPSASSSAATDHNQSASSAGFEMSIASRDPPFLNTGARSSPPIASFQAQSGPSAPVFCAPTQDPANTAAVNFSSSAAAADQASLSLTTGASSSGGGTKLPSENIGTNVEEERAAKFQKWANAIAGWDRRTVRSQNALLGLNNAVETFAAAHTTLMEQIDSIDAYQEEVHMALMSIEEKYESICKDEHDWIQGDDAAPAREAMYEQVESIREELKQMQDKAMLTLCAVREIQGGERNGAVRRKMLGLLVLTLDDLLSALKSFDERVKALSTRIEEFGAQATVEDQ